MLKTDHHTGRALLLLNEEGVIEYCSPAVANFYGENIQALVGQPVINLFPELPIRASTPGYNRAYVIYVFRDSQWLAFAGKDSEGETLSLEVSLAALQLNGRVLFLLELRAPPIFASAEEKLQRFQEVSEWSADAISITSARGIIEYVNPAFEALTGYSKAEVLGRTHAILKGGVHEPKFYADMWAVLQANKTFRAQFVNRHKNGTLFYEDQVIRPFHNNNGEITHYVATGRDVSERMKIMRRLEHLANHDGLTGLPNRSLFLDRLQQATTRAARCGDGFAVMLLDLDHFKAINDTLGHAVGDAVLQTAASRLRQSLRDEDTVARLGGDEFALILEKTAQRQDVEIVLEKMTEMLRQPLNIESQTIAIQASIGVAFYPSHGEDAHTLLKHADSAMYKVKAAGGANHLFCDKKELPHIPRSGKAGS